jgi:hypothetical protein
MSGRFVDRISATGEGSHSPLWSTSAYQLSSLHLSQIVLCIYRRLKSTVDKADRLLMCDANVFDCDTFRLCNIKQKTLSECPIGLFFLPVIAGYVPFYFHFISETGFESYLAIRVSV